MEQRPKIRYKSYSLIHSYRTVCQNYAKSNFASCYSILISDYREHKTIKENEFGSLETAHALHMHENLCKSKAKPLSNLLYFILWCNFLYICAIADIGLSPALLLIGLILVKEWMVENLYLTALTVIEYYSVLGRWILKNISERENSVRCVRPSIQRDAVCVWWLMKLDWNVINRAATFYWSHLCCIRVDVFASKASIHTIYTNQSSLFEHPLHACTHKVWVKGQTPTPMSPPIIFRM